MKYHTSALLSGGTKKCVVIGKRENKLGNVLYGPGKYIVKGHKYMLKHIECMCEQIIGVYIIFQRMFCDVVTIFGWGNSTCA